MVTTKKLFEAIETISLYCREQDCCQNCILRKHAPDHWGCRADLDLNEIKAILEAKKKKHGYID